MSFGYGVGDFIAGANLSYRLIQALSETQGASIEYQEAIAELSTLQQTFLQVSQMRASQTLAQATINAASEIVMSSMELIGAFLARTKKYREKLCGRGSGNKVSDSWQKMGWVLFKKEELKRLRDDLHLKLSHISLLISTAQIHGKIPPSIAKYEVDNFEKSSSRNRTGNESSQTQGSHVHSSRDKTATRDAENTRESSRTSDSELQKRLLVIEELMKSQKIDFPKAQKEIATSDAREVAEAEEIVKKQAEEEKAAWEKKFEEEKKAAQARGAENARKQIEAERKRAEDKAAEEMARADAKAAVLQAELLAKTAVEKAEAKAEAAVQAAIKRAQSEADEAVAKAKKEAADLIEQVLGNTRPNSIKKKPIRFKDAVGRKFSFPFELCSTWNGMEELIRQAFLHVELIGPHVAEGHYDLIGPNGEIILPQVWETMIEPDWAITMHMWPMPEPKKPSGPPPPPPPGWPGFQPPPRPAKSRSPPSNQARFSEELRPPTNVSFFDGNPSNISEFVEQSDPASRASKSSSKGVLSWMHGARHPKRPIMPTKTEALPPTFLVATNTSSSLISQDMPHLESDSQLSETASSTVVELVSNRDEVENFELREGKKTLEKGESSGTETESLVTVRKHRRRRPRRRRPKIAQEVITVVPEPSS